MGNPVTPYVTAFIYNHVQGCQEQSVTSDVLASVTATRFARLHECAIIP